MQMLPLDVWQASYVLQEYCKWRAAFFVISLFIIVHKNLHSLLLYRFLTDIAGVLDKEMKLLDRLSCDDIDKLIDDDTITGGMIPKGKFDTY